MEFENLSMNAKVIIILFVITYEMSKGSQCHWGCRKQSLRGVSMLETKLTCI